jgi:2-polyprenyl-3-methyl-5-hydroxy-6-metoxy-1,4-benzoquinol methylase
VDPTYGLRYAELYRRHWWWRTREAAILAELRRLRPPAPSEGRRILDVGCGDGLFFDRLSAFGEVEGVEPDASLLRAEGPWRRAIHAVPFDEGFRPGHRFDAILMLDVLEHMQQPAAALRHALRLLAPGGVVIITVPAFQWLWTRHDDLNQHVRRYDRRSFKRMVHEAGGGLRILRERYLFQWVVAAKLAVRGWEALRPGAPAPPSIPPAPINGVLAAVSRLELALARRVPLPVGSTLMVSGVAEESSAGS